ncbi:hypothetical protein Pyn_17338 [Prunus yedoensis var. nudiflora]|uniref:Uncharacterized protein n=1 Tax=Prunus yedoensis var. nudiflora TaxID=2094558 RepID=A0A314YBF6_PRUYE|nr:hypothetical protein Pyn_17338 [Prunus yedoensis var. nudiflora]
MLDLYELAVKLGYTKQTRHTLESQASVPSGAAQGNKGQQLVVEHVDVGGEGFVDVDVDLETNDDGNVDGYGVMMNAQFGEGFTDDVFDDDLNRYGESVNVDEFVDIDVQVEDEDEEEPGVKDYAYREIEFKQNDEDYEKESGEANTDEYDIDDLRSVHDSKDEENTAVRGKTRRIAPRFK